MIWFTHIQCYPPFTQIRWAIHIYIYIYYTPPIKWDAHPTHLLTGSPQLLHFAMGSDGLFGPSSMTDRELRHALADMSGSSGSSAIPQDPGTH